LLCLISDRLPHVPPGDRSGQHIQEAIDGGGYSSYATGINNSGQVVGASRPGDNPQAFL
jgi:hypothetical protein